MSKEQRGNQRYEVALDLDYARVSAWRRGRTKNISIGGLFLVAEEPFAPGDIVRLRLALPQIHETIESRAIVRWLDDGGAGLQFDGLRARDVWALGKYFESL